VIGSIIHTQLVITVAMGIAAKGNRSRLINRHRLSWKSEGKDLICQFEKGKTKQQGRWKNRSVFHFL